jgi:MFS family permease
VRRETTLRCALVVSFLAAVAQGLFLVLFVLFVLRTLDAGDAVVGLLRGLQAIGGVLGGVIVGVWAGRLGARILAAGGFAAFGVISLITWNSPAVTSAVWWYGVLFVAVGIPATALNSGLITGVQDTSPVSLRGRVLGLMGVAEALGQGGGILAAGLLSGSVSLTALLNGQAGCYLACASLAAAGIGRPPPHWIRSRRGSARPIWESGTEIVLRSRTKGHPRKVFVRRDLGSRSEFAERSLDEPVSARPGAEGRNKLMKKLVL